ncbi:MAG: membrane protein insertase YidC [Pseudomonadota bacterium]
MNDIRRTILWVVFGFSMVMLWDQWQIHNGQPATFFPQSGKAVATAPAPVGTASSVPQPTAAAAGALPPGSTPTTAPTAPRERVTVTTDVLRLTFDTLGASVVHAELLKHSAGSVTDKKTSGAFVLLDETPASKYVAQTGLVGGDFPNHTTEMTFTGERTLRDGQNDLVLRFESPDKGGVKLVTTYTLRRGSYAVAVRHEVINTGAAQVSPQFYAQLVRGATTSGGSFITNPTGTFTGPAVYTPEKKYQKIEFSSIDKDKVDFQKQATAGWVAMVQHYFTGAWILPDGVARENFVRKVDGTLYSVGMLTTVEVAPGATKAVQSTLFLGPQEEKVLESVAPGLDLVKDYGIFTILAKPLYWLMDKLHGYIGNWGWTIMALVLLIKIAFYWLQAKGYQSMAKMKAVNPRVMAMRERFKDNPQQMQQEMMKIYREEKVNPLGGCLPIVVQIPVFIALYWVLLSSVEMRNAPWIGWIRDLSTPDPYFILPVVMTLTTVLQTALNPQPPDPMQAKMMWIMPLVFSVMFFFFPAGLVLYWITNNVLSIAQQWLINTRMGVPPQFNLPKFR